MTTERSWAASHRVRKLVGLAAASTLAALALLVVGALSASADYDTDCAAPTAVYDAGTMPTSLNLAASDVVVFASGTFTGPVNSSGAVICVAEPAAFAPASLNGFARVFVRGEATFPAIAAGSGASLDNEGTVTFLQQTNVNGIADIVNRAGATLVVQSSVSFGAGITVTNDGTLEVTGSVNFGGALTNNASTTIGGVLVLTGSVTNNATMTVGGLTTIDSGGTLTNSCRYASDGLISNDTIVNAGVIDLGAGDFLNNGPADLTQTASGIVLGQDFDNNGTITGGGQMQFAGITANRGSFTGSSAGAPIVFDDLSPTGDQVLDLELGTITNVVRGVVTPPGPDQCGTGPPTTTTTTTSTTTTTTTTTTSTTTTTTSTTSTTTTSTTVPTTSTTSTTVPTSTSTTGPAPSTTGTTSGPPPTTDPGGGGNPPAPDGPAGWSGGALPRTGDAQAARLAAAGVLLLVAGTALGRAAAAGRSRND